MGNERMDLLTEKRALETQKPTRTSSFHSTKNLTNMTFKHIFKSETEETFKVNNWEILTWTPLVCLMSQEKLLSQSLDLINHDCLKFPLFRIDITITPDCTLCNPSQPNI
ncbi:hypothetical protein CEXT_301641 [Caerostris extrusa]|uniref:Uncharacterized protein n=1 Tax=Caerostris extrusa TaxID=172846 RepID=A0AAV4TGF2_CAEEX|nr:hypothetical protein CEXT_301641 [Caerostris extrusa]